MTTAPLSLSAHELGTILEIETEAFSHPWTVADFQWLSQDDRSLNLGLWKGAVLVGYAIGIVEGPAFHLASIAINSPSRRRGWGSHLLQAALRRAVERGCRFCRLEVRASNHAAIRMYEKSGFVADGVRRRFYTNPVEDARQMRRVLIGEPEPQPTIAA